MTALSVWDEIWSCIENNTGPSGRVRRDKWIDTNRGITTTNITDTITTYSLRALVEISGIEMDTGHMGIVK